MMNTYRTEWKTRYSDPIDVHLFPEARAAYPDLHGTGMSWPKRYSYQRTVINQPHWGSEGLLFPKRVVILSFRNLACVMT